LRPEITDNIDEISARLDRVQERVEAFIPRLLWLIGGKAHNAILFRSLRGVDLDGNPYKPYSTRPLYITDSPYVDGNGYWPGGYEQYKAAMGKKDWHVLTGEMMGSLALHEVSRSLVVLQFATQEARIKALENQRRRSFVGLTDKEVDGIAQYATREVAEVIRDAWVG